MKKVLLLTQHLDAGGIEINSINILKNINKQKFDISFMCCESNYNYYEDYIEKLGAKVYKGVYISGVINKLVFCKTLYQLLVRHKFDVVHSNMGIFDIFTLLTATLARVPIRISHAHFTQSQYAHSWMKNKTIALLRNIFRHSIFLFANTKIGCSQAANDYCFGKQANAQIIYNGIEVNLFQKAEASTNNLFKRSHGIKHNILTIGRIVYLKNPMFIAQTILELSRIRKDFRFIWVGVGAMENDVKVFVKNNNIDSIVIFLQKQSDIKGILKASDIFLLPSLAEGLGLSAVEAQISGLDCFVSDKIPTEAILGKCVTLPLEKGARHWAEKISEHLDSGLSLTIDEVKKMKFDIKYTVKEIEKIYEGI